MSMIHCRECGEILSLKEDVCPHCGAKQPRKSLSIKWIALLFLATALIIAGLLMSETAPTSEPERPKPSKQLTEHQRLQQEKLLVDELRTIPAREIYKNKIKYKNLLELFPSNQKYINKHTYYANKVQDLEKKIGERPTFNESDRVPYAVKTFVKKSAYDKESIKFESCSNISFSNNEWTVSCKYKEKNMKGVMSLKNYRFTLRHNSVVNSRQIF